MKKTAKKAPKKTSLAKQSKRVDRQIKKDLKAAVKRKLIDKATAKRAAQVIDTNKPRVTAAQTTVRPLVEATVKTDAESARAIFKKFHGSCPLCHGEDPFCRRLGVRPNGDGTDSWVPDFSFEKGPVGLAIQTLRREEHLKKETMPEATKAALREQRASAKADKPARPKRQGPTVFVVCAGAAKTWATKDQITAGMMKTEGWPRDEKQTKQLVHSLLGHHLAKRGWKVERKGDQWRVTGEGNGNGKKGREKK